MGAGIGLGLAGFILMLLAMFLPVVAVVAAPTDLLAWAGIGATFVWLGVVVVLMSALGQLYRSAVYLYAAEGLVPAGFDEMTLRRALRGARPRAKLRPA